MNKLKLKSIFKTTVLSILISTIILTILFAIFSMVVLYSNISSSAISQGSTILGAIGLFLASFVTARVINKKGLLIGFSIGMLVAVLIFILTFFATGIIFKIGTLIKAITIVICSCLGGIFGVNSKQ